MIRIRANSRPGPRPWLRTGIVGFALACAVRPVYAQDNTQPPVQTPPTGVAPLPTTPPPTGLQAPVPPPVKPLPRPDRPQRVSPSLLDVYGRAVSGPIDIDQAVAIALGNSRDLATATEALLQAQGRTSEARAAFNPTLSAGFSYTRLNQGQSATFSGQTIVITNPDAPQFTASLALPIDIAGELRVATQQAQFQEVATRIDINRTRNQIVINVKNAFYNVLREQALVTVDQETLKDDLDRLSDAQKKLAAGTVAPFDVLRAQTDVANAQQQLITDSSNVSIAIANLNNVLGIAIDTPLQISDRKGVENPPGVQPPTGSPPAPAPQAPLQSGGQALPSTQNSNMAHSLVLGPEYDAVVTEAISNRPEILEADAQIAAARKGIQLARRSALPSLSLSLNGTYAPNTAGFAPQTTTGSLTIGLTAPIFDGGVSRARIEQQRAVYAQEETSRRQAVDQVTLDVRIAYLTLLQARDRVVVANQALAEAQESYRLARVRYNNGISTLVEVSDAQAALTLSENNQVNALYDYNNDRASLDRAAGRYAYVGAGPGYPAPPGRKTVGDDQTQTRAGGQK